MRVLAGLQSAAQGQVKLGDQIITGPSPQTAIMFQDANLMPWRTVIENIALPLELAGVPRAEREAAAHMLLPTLGLSDFADAYPLELSGGMAQRAALGRVLVQRPSLLLLDEPFGALDAMTREQVSFDLLTLWQRQQPTILMVTHDLHEAVLLADRVLVMSRRPGRVIADIPVTLPRPRTIALSYEPVFVQIAREVRTAIERA
jgi:NitT/TauT family transport system ATP-binding protein